MIGIRTNQRQQQITSQRHQQRCQSAQQQSTPKAKRTDALHAVILSGTQRTGNKRTPANAEQIPKCHQHGKHWGCKRNCIHLIRVMRLSDKYGIRHVVQNRNQHTQYRRQRQHQHRLWNRFHFKYILFFFSHSPISFIGQNEAAIYSLPHSHF